MKKTLSAIAVSLTVTAAFLLIAPVAMAHDQPHVNWSVSIGTPYAAAPVYGPPQIVYVEPQPVYLQPVPAVQYRTAYGRPYYVEETRIIKPHHWKHHHHDYRD